MDSGISVPSVVESSIVCPLVVYLNGKGTLEHIINGHGESTSSTHGASAVPAWYFSSGPAPPQPPRPPLPAPTPVPTPSPPAPSPQACAVGDHVPCPGSSV